MSEHPLVSAFQMKIGGCLIPHGMKCAGTNINLACASAESVVGLEAKLCSGTL